MNILSSFAVLVGAGFLSGCASFNTAANFERADASGIDGSKTQLVLIGPFEPRDEALERVKKFAPGMDTSWLNADAECVKKPNQPAPAVAAPLVPILAAVGEVAFTLWADAQQRKIEALVESAQASYASTLTLSPERLEKARCVAMLRYTEDGKGNITAGLSAVLRFDDQGLTPDGLSRSFTVTPIHVRMVNSVAVTRKAAEPTTSLAFAVSIKAIGTPEGGVQRLLPSGEGVTAVPGVKLGQAPRCRDATCKTSDLVPYPVKAGKLSLTVAIAEQGVTGFDDKAALAELAAVKAALGPAIGEAIKKKLGQ